LRSDQVEEGLTCECFILKSRDGVDVSVTGRLEGKFDLKLRKGKKGWCRESSLFEGSEMLRETQVEVSPSLLLVSGAKHGTCFLKIKSQQILQVICTQFTTYYLLFYSSAEKVNSMIEG